MLLSSFTLQSSSIDEVIGALRSGNASQLSNYFDENVGLTLPDKSDVEHCKQVQVIIVPMFS